MKTGPHIDISVPENFNLATYFLDENLAKGRENKAAIYCRDETYTFGDLCSLTNRIGNAMKELDVGFEDRVLLILQDSPEWMASWYATMKVGGVATHAYTYLKPDDYAYFMNYVRPKVVIADHTTIKNVREGARRTEYAKTILVAGDDLPELRKGERSLKSMIHNADEHLEAAVTSRDDLALWNFSGGTTGKPKAVPHMHHDGVFGFESLQQIVHYTEKDVVLRVPKLFFHYSRDSGMNYAIRAGAAIALFPDNPEKGAREFSFHGEFTLLLTGTDRESVKEGAVVRLKDLCNVMVLSEDSNIDLNFSLYPNPNNGIFTIDFTESQPTDYNRFLSIVSIDGRVIHTAVILKDELTKELNLAYIDPGIYIVRIIENNMVQTNRFIKY